MNGTVTIRVNRVVAWEKEYANAAATAARWHPDRSNKHSARMPREAQRAVARAFEEAVLKGSRRVSLDVTVTTGRGFRTFSYPYRDPIRAAQAWRLGCPNTAIPRRVARDLREVFASKSARPFGARVRRAAA